MGKTLYRKFVAQASDCTEETPHLRADCYAFGQARKLGLSMCMTASGKVEVRRKDALSQPVTLTIREVFVDEQGHEYDADGKIAVENPGAHNFTVLTRGYLAVKDGDVARAAQIFEPEAVKVAGKEKWELKPTNTKAIAAKAEATAKELELRVAAIRAANAKPVPAK